MNGDDDESEAPGWTQSRHEQRAMVINLAAEHSRFLQSLLRRAVDWSEEGGDGDAGRRGDRGDRLPRLESSDGVATRGSGGGEPPRERPRNRSLSDFRKPRGATPPSGPARPCRHRPRAASDGGLVDGCPGGERGRASWHGPSRRASMGDEGARDDASAEARELSGDCVARRC